MISMRSALLAMTGLLASSLGAQAQPLSFNSNPTSSFGPDASALCVDGQCQPAISQTIYEGREAFRLTDGKSEAVVVPSLGRVMRFGKVGGENLLWNSPASTQFKAGDWKNYGGDKTWLSPQSSWGTFHGKNGWPPDPAFDGTPHQPEVLSGGKLKLVSNTSPRLGIRLERVMWFSDAGEFVIEQSAVKTSGEPVRVGLWSISQSAPGTVFVPLAPDSAYQNGFMRFGNAPSTEQSVSTASEMLRLDPQARGGGAKFGVDAPVASLASVRGGLAWVQRSAKPKGQYPDGAEDHGFPVEIYVNGDQKTFYVELELLGPLVNMVKGQKQTHTVRWSLHDLPSTNVDDGATQSALAALLR